MRVLDDHWQLLKHGLEGDSRGLYAVMKHTNETLQ